MKSLKRKKLSACLILPFSLICQLSLADPLSIDGALEQISQVPQDIVDEIQSIPTDNSNEPKIELPVELNAGLVTEGLATELDAELPLELGSVELQAELNSAGLSIEASVPQQIIGLNGQLKFAETLDEAGQLAVKQEWVMQISSQQMAQLNALVAQQQIKIIEQENLDALEVTVVRVHVDAQLDSLSALKAALLLDDEQVLSRNHIYQVQSSALNTQADMPAEKNMKTTKAKACAQAINIGMIDTAVDIYHPAFKRVQQAGRIIQQSFVDPDLAQPTQHGSAVAGLLVGEMANLQPLLPQGKIYSAAAFYTRPDGGQGATMFNLVKALNWLAKQPVSVINMSLTGPDNGLLKTAIEALSKQQITIVAAVGNAGPASPPLYPAAYAAVIGVTAVDHKNNIYRWAVRGKQVDFAATGVDVFVPRINGSIKTETGTSMASPIVAAHLLCLINGEKKWPQESRLMMRRYAQDLGELGKDDTYGYGLIGKVKSPD
ncbi:S8 family serine peptidase [Catenovulum sediminis]|uniref:S8 family serine peptidase n=1 Tax=Catenovulum sediminis TaxID=1740262 RepID=A0ABV1RFK5_9ALTE